MNEWGISPVQRAYLSYLQQLSVLEDWLKSVLPCTDNELDAWVNKYPLFTRIDVLKDLKYRFLSDPDVIRKDIWSQQESD